jgi:hypothetical protein
MMATLADVRAAGLTAELAFEGDPDVYRVTGPPAPPTADPPPGMTAFPVEFSTMLVDDPAAIAELLGALA